MERKVQYRLKALTRSAVLGEAFQPGSPHASILTGSCSSELQPQMEHKSLTMTQAAPGIALGYELCTKAELMNRAPRCWFREKSAFFFGGGGPLFGIWCCPAPANTSAPPSEARRVTHLMV